MCHLNPCFRSAWKNDRSVDNKAYVPTNKEHLANILTHGVRQTCYKRYKIFPRCWFLLPCGSHCWCIGGPPLQHKNGELSCFYLPKNMDRGPYDTLDKNPLSPPGLPVCMVQYSLGSSLYQPYFTLSLRSATKGTLIMFSSLREANFWNVLFPYWHSLKGQGGRVKAC